MKRVIVAGGGASGILAAYAAAINGNDVTLFEKNSRIGKKLLITGNGRCNITNMADMETTMDKVVSNPRFLHSAFNAFKNEDIIELLRSAGVRTKVEENGRVFPYSGKSTDIVDVFEKLLFKSGVKMCMERPVSEILIENGRCLGIKDANGKTYLADVTIVTTGGLSYPVTGSTGDGLSFARKCGLKIIEPRPALVSVNAAEEWVKQLQGVSVKNVAVTAFAGKKRISHEYGDLLFTHYGVSGPVVIDASSTIIKKWRNIKSEEKIILSIDLMREIDSDQCMEYILNLMNESGKRQVRKVLAVTVPAALAEMVTELSGTEPEKAARDVTKSECRRMADVLKNLRITVSGMRGFREAVITQGGVDTREIDPRTMSVKKISGLKFAGEVLDLDARTGGFNLQIAWSTGWVAGSTI